MEIRPKGLVSMTRIIEEIRKAACLNGHDPEAIETRENGARVCTKCSALYSFKNRSRRPVNESRENVRTS